MRYLERMYHWYVKIPLAERKVLRRKREHDNGFDFGAGVLLRKEESPASLEAYAYRGDFSNFDYGVLAAMEKLVSSGAVEDDRF